MVLARASPSTPAQRRPVAAVDTTYSAQQPPASSARPNPTASTLVGPAPNRVMPRAARPTHTKSRGGRLAAQPRPDKGEQDQGTGGQPEEHHPHRGNLAEQAFGDHRTKLHRKDADQNEPYRRKAGRGHAVHSSVLSSWSARYLLRERQ